MKNLLSIAILGIVLCGTHTAQASAQQSPPEQTVVALQVTEVASPFQDCLVYKIEAVAVPALECVSIQGCEFIYEFTRSTEKESFYQVPLPFYGVLTNQVLKPQRTAGKADIKYFARSNC